MSNSIKSKRKIVFRFNSKLLYGVDGTAGESSGSRLLGDEVISKHLGGNFLNLLSGINNVDSTLEATCKCSESTSSSENLSFDNVFSSSGEFRAHLVGVFRAESNSTNGSGDLVGVKQSSGLVLMELKSSHGERSILDESAV